MIDNRPSWLTIYARMALIIADRSRDPDTKVGAVIVDPESKTILSMGYNGMPRRVDDNVMDRYRRPDKYYYFEHAERNAIYNALRFGVPLNGSHLICTHIPCAACTRAIIQVGINQVFTLETSIPEHRKEDVARAGEMLKEVDIPLLWIGEFDAIC